MPINLNKQSKRLIRRVWFFYCLWSSLLCFSQIKSTVYYPKDSLLFKQQSGFDFSYQKETFGKTTMAVKTNSAWGELYFIFKKKIKNISHFGGDYSDVYGHKKDGSWGVVRKDYNEPYTVSEHDLFALILESNHGRLTEKARFQDFGNEVYWPEFDYPNCFVSDENHDDIPEFYLSYLGMSDGLDAKPFKQIIYTFSKSKKKLIKSKATAYSPAGNPEDKYYEVFDLNWKNLPKEIQKRSLKILKTVDL